MVYSRGTLAGSVAPIPDTRNQSITGTGQVLGVDLLQLTHRTCVLSNYPQRRGYEVAQVLVVDLVNCVHTVVRVPNRSVCKQYVMKRWHSRLDAGDEYGVWL
jgi:hypothetical protein